MRKNNIGLLKKKKFWGKNRIFISANKTNTNKFLNFLFFKRSFIENPFGFIRFRTCRFKLSRAVVLRQTPLDDSEVKSFGSLWTWCSRTLFSTNGSLFDPFKHRDPLGPHFLIMNKKTTVDLNKTIFPKASLINSIVLTLFFPNFKLFVQNCTKIDFIVVHLKNCNFLYTQPN